MKKLCAASLAICLFASTSSYTAILDDVRNAKKQLTEALNQINEAKQMLETTYTDINTTVIAQATTGISLLTSNQNEVGKKMEDIKKMVGGNALKALGLSTIFHDQTWTTSKGLESVCLSDLMDTLSYIKDQVLAWPKEVLTNLKNDFVSVNDQLNSKTDPLGVFTDFATSATGFQSAIKSLEKIEQDLVELAATASARSKSTKRRAKKVR